jgi:hypothetical protein
MKLWNLLQINFKNLSKQKKLVIKRIMNRFDREKKA